MGWIISMRMVREFLQSHPGARRDADIFRRWERVVRNAHWQNFADVRNLFPDADLVGENVVFNVGGNKYRIVARLHYGDTVTRIFLRHVVTHAEYDKLDLC